MNMNYTLNMLEPGEYAIIEELLASGPIHRRLLDIGLIKGTKVECIGRSPCGDPAAYFIRGTVIAIRNADSRNILIRPYCMG